MGGAVIVVVTLVRWIVRVGSICVCCISLIEGKERKVFVSNFVVKNAPVRLVALGLWPGKEFEIVRKRGYLYQIKFDNINVIICKVLLSEIEID